jgi:hypothetical protein
MAQGTKITFSKSEFDAITHTDFFFTKHAALQKVMELLSETQQSLKEVISPYNELSHYTDTASPKIFRGENYRQLPYMVLDYPRKFTTETVFAFRSMFWWGKEFSFTLHIQGKALEHFRLPLEHRMENLAGKNFYYCIHHSPWQYYFESDNYVPLEELLNDVNFSERIGQAAFIKLARKLPVGDFERVPPFASDTLDRLLKMLFA